jgi:hypothetical protein
MTGERESSEPHAPPPPSPFCWRAAVLGGHKATLSAVLCLFASLPPAPGQSSPPPHLFNAALFLLVKHVLYPPPHPPPSLLPNV